MRLAVKYERNGPATFVSHLDLQRTAMRALRRSGLPVAYSEGFNPHILLSFASALAVGLKSNGEYFEVRLTHEVESEQALIAMQDSFPEGMCPVFAGRLADDEKKLMAAVEYARYDLLTSPETARQLLALRDEESIVLHSQRKGKISEREVRPLLREIDKIPDGVTLLLKAGSTDNVNIFDLIETLRNKGNVSGAIEILRQELYTQRDGVILPLSELCV